MLILLLWVDGKMGRPNDGRSIALKVDIDDESNL